MSDATSSYVGRVGEGLDELLNTILLAGEPKETISLHAAKAEEDGKRWGCILCKWLSISVETDHCQKTLRGENITTIAGLKAIIQLGFIATLISLGYSWLIKGII